MINNKKSESWRYGIHIGVVYTARDAAHRKYANFRKNEPMPFDFTGAAVYYAGPCPQKPGKPIGSVVLPRVEKWIYIRLL